MAPLPGFGMFKGLWVTFRRLIDTYLVDLRWRGKRYRSPEGLQDRLSYKTRGIFTIQYPEERIPSPENFRYVPFLVYDELEGWRAEVALHSLWDVRASVSAAMHLDHTRGRSRDEQTPQPAGRIRDRGGRVHELRAVRRVLPVRCHPDGPQLRAGFARPLDGPALSTLRNYPNRQLPCRHPSPARPAGNPGTCGQKRRRSGLR